MEWFKTWFDTEYYHLLYRNRSYAEADAFVEKLFEAGILKPGMRILELACGKGRHAVAMHRLGATVVGVDLSPHAIEAAKAYEEPGLSFYVHDMRAPFPQDLHGLDAVTNLFTSFAYFEDECENETVLKNVAQVLAPGGTFVLDFMNVLPVIQNLAPVYDQELDGVKFHIEKKYEHGHIIKTIWVDDHGTAVGPFQERVQAFSPEKLAMFCQEAGLEVDNVFGDYKLGPLLADTSPRCILVCKSGNV
jgi:SAM-dependent methyltransferase